MLPKTNRADKKATQKIFKEGSFLNSPNLTLKFVLETKDKPPRISFIAPKNIAKTAVKRNLLKRRGHQALKGHLKDLPAGLMGAFIFKKYQEDSSVLENEIKNILHKIN